MMSLFSDTQADVIEAFNSTCRYLDILLYILYCLNSILTILVLKEC